MKRFVNYHLIAAIVGATAMLAMSCHQDNLTPELSFDKTEFEVPATGGKVEVPYSISNPASGAEWYYTCDCEWVEDCDFTTDGVITITVSPNYVEEERSGVVTFVYSALDMEFPVTLIQQAGSPMMPSVVFDPATAEVAAEGGLVTVSYTVENPVAGESLSGTVDAEWITELNTSVDGEVSFYVSLSYVEQKRTADIKFNYADMEFVLPVVQAEGNPDDAFDLTMTDITPITATIKVVPADSVMTYTVFPTDKDYYETITDEDFIAQMLNAYAAIASMVGLSFEEFMEQQVLATKTSYWTKDQLIPNTEYIFMVLGMEADGTVTTKHFIVDYTTEQTEDVDVTFELEIDPDELSAIVTTKPSRDDIKYYTEVRPLTDLPQGADMTKVDYQDWVNYKIWMGSVMGKSPQQVIEEVAVSGTQTKEFFNLSSDTEYVAFTGAVDPDGVVISDCEAVVFRTEQISSSENTFDVTITEEVAAIVVDVVPTVMEDEYAVVVAELADCEGMTDEEYAAEAAKTFQVLMNRQSGVATVRVEALNMLWKLCSDTEYKLFIFGIKESTVTTAVTSYLVKTLPAEDPKTFTADITVKDITSTGATLDITVNQQTTLYVAGFVPADFTSEQTLERIDIYAQRWIDNGIVDHKPRFMGYIGVRGDIVDGTSFYLFNEIGYQTSLEPGKQYKPYVVAVNDKTAEYASVIFGETFTTSAGISTAPRIIPDNIANFDRHDVYKEEVKFPKDEESDLSYRLGKMLPTRKK